MPDNEDGRGTVTKPAGFNPFADEFSATPTPDTNTVVDEENGEVEVEEVEPGVRAPVAVPKPAPKPTTVTRPNAQEFKREIDLGDGSGKQVFKADSAEELLDILTEAQTNATRKIREQQFALKRAERARPERVDTPVTPKVKQEFTADELFQLTTTLQKNPVAAVDAVVKAKTGLDLDALGAMVQQWNQAQATNAADVQFLTKHAADYVPSAANAARIEKFLQDEKLSHTSANLEFAFQELSEGGLLEGSSPADDAQSSNGSRIVVQQHERKKPMSTGLRSSQASGRSSAVEEQAKPGALSESEVEQLYRLPIEEARVLMNKKIAEAKRSSQR